MSYLEMKGITKRFAGAAVLDGVDLDVAEGELITLLGPSGCGKSTLLRCISGLTEMEAGAIRIDGREVSALAPRDREIGMVFQSYALFPNLTVEDNIAYGLRMRKLGKAERESRVEELLRLIDLEAKRRAYPHELSGGQQQRVALARSLAVRPKVLLLDEPLSALDAKIRKTLRAEIRRIQKQLKMTTIFVTHDQEEALTVSDRVCVMQSGRIVQIGAPEEIYARPRTEFVARFIGHYNVLAREEAARLPGFAAAAPDAGSYAIRPEAIRLAPSPAAGSSEGGALTVPGVVRSVTVLGSIVRYVVEAAGLSLTVDRLNEGGAAGIGEGDGVVLTMDRSQLLPLAKEGA